MATQIRNRTWKDVDGSKLWVQRGFESGKTLFDTDPDSPGINSMVQLTPAEVDELIKFLRPNG